MNTRPSHKSLTESHHRAEMRTLRVIAAALTCVVFVHPAIADIPGATLAPATNLSAPVYPRNLAAAPDGKIWYSEERLTPHSVGFFTPDGIVTKFPVPCDQCDGNGTRLAYIESIAVGPDSNVWFPYTYVNGDGSPLNGGMNNFIGRFTPTGQFTSFPMPTLNAFQRFAFGQSGHSAITSGPDGNLWFTENIAGKIGKITTAGVITEYPLASNLAAPSIMTKGPDGNLWFTETGAGKIGRITTNGTIAEFTAPKGTRVAAPFGITTGADGNLWYTDWSGAIGRMTVAGVGTRFEILEPSSQPNCITTGSDGKLYFPYFTFIGTKGDYQGKVAQVDPSTASPSGGLGFNFTPFPNKEFGNEIVAAPSAAATTSSGSFGPMPAGPLKLDVSVSAPDSTGQYIDSLWILYATTEPLCPTITTPTVPNGVVAVTVYNVTLSATGGSGQYTWSGSGMPKGVTVTPSGVLTGTPQETGTFVVTLMATDKNRPECPPATASFTMTVNPAPPPAQHDSTANKPHAPVNGDPVNTATGELFFTETPDLSLGGPMPVVFARYYASLLSHDGNVDAHLGQNWSHNFAWRLRKEADPARLTAIDWRGRSIPFAQSGSSWSLASPSDVPWQLVQTASTYLLGDPLNEMVYTFDSSGALTKIEDTHGNAESLTYANGLLASATDGLGRLLTFAYDGSNRMTSVGDGTRSVHFTYGGNNLASATDATASTTAYAYDSNGNLMRATLPMGNSRYAQTFDASGRVLTQTTATNNASSFAYGSGKTTSTDAAGNATTQTFASTSDSAMTGFTDAAGRTAVIGSDQSGRRNSVTDRLGDTTTSTYDSNSGKLLDLVRADGTHVRFTYGSRTFNGITLSPLTQIDRPDGTTVSFAYDANGNLTSRTDAAGKNWTYTTNAHGQPLTITNPTGGTTTYTYNNDGTLASSHDSDTAATTFGYDALHRLISTTAPDGATVKVGYDADNRVTSITDKNGQTYTFEYDGNGNLLRVTDPTGSKRQYGYDALDHVKQMTDALGHATNFSFDSLDLLSSITDANGNSTSLGYDSSQRLSNITDGSGKSWSLERDNEGVPTAARTPMGLVRGQTTNRLGYKVSTTDAAGAVTASTRDAMQRVTSVSDPLSRTTRVTYDARGALSSFTSPAGASVRFDRDDAGRPTRLTDAAGGRWAYAYTAAGRPKSSTDPSGRTETLSYDSRGQLSRVDFPDGAVAQMTHDTAGNLTRVSFSDGVDLTYGFDALNRLTSAGSVAISRDPEGRVTGTMQSGASFGATYDAAGRVSTVSYNNGAMIVSYSYDARNLITRVSDNLSNAFVALDYDNEARLTGIRRSNGVNATYALNANGRITAIHDGSFMDVQLTRNAAGEVTAESGTFPLEPGVVAGDDSQTFAYDASGQPAGASVSVDGRGRPSWSTMPVTYDGDSRLTQVGGMKYTWNALDQMSSRADSSGTTTLFYDRHFLAAEKKGSSVRYYVHTPNGMPLYAVDSGTAGPSFYHFDENGSTVALSNSSGQPTDTYAYDPLGVLLGRSGVTQQPFQFLSAFNVLTDGGLLFGGKHAVDPLRGAAAGVPQLPSAWRIEPSIDNTQNTLKARVTSFLDDDPVPANPLGNRETVTSKPPVPATAMPLLGAPSTALQLIAEPQHSGDSKIQIEIGFHMWLRVNVYDKAGNVQGQRSLQFAPWMSSNGEGSFATNAPKADDSLFFFVHNGLEAIGAGSISVSSTEFEDKLLLYHWNKNAAYNTGERWNPLQNCWVTSIKYACWTDIISAEPIEALRLAKATPYTKPTFLNVAPPLTLTDRIASVGKEIANLPDTLANWLSDYIH